jgi:hypothetical protein
MKGLASGYNKLNYVCWHVGNKMACSSFNSFKNSSLTYFSNEQTPEGKKVRQGEIFNIFLLYRSSLFSVHSAESFFRKEN